MECFNCGVQTNNGFLCFECENPRSSDTKTAIEYQRKMHELRMEMDTSGKLEIVKQELKRQFKNQRRIIRPMDMSNRGRFVKNTPENVEKWLTDIAKLRLSRN